MNIIHYIFSTEWMPHSACYIGDNKTLLVNLIGDLMFSIAYFLIPLGLFLWIIKQTEAVSTYSYKLLIIGFAAFIFLCGISHIFDIIVVYYPLYRLQGYERILGGLTSLIVAWLLFRPKFRKTKVISYVVGDKIATEIQLPTVKK